MSPPTFRVSNLDDIVTVCRNDKADFNPEPVSIPEVFIKQTNEYNDYIALVSKDDKTYTYKQYYEEALKVAKSLIKVGLQRKDVVGIIGFNSPEYFFTFHGCWMADCVSTGIYTTNNPAACKYVLKNSNAKICVCEGGKQAEKIMSIAHQLPNLSTIVVYWPEEGMPAMNPNKTLDLYTWDEFLDLSKEVTTDVVMDRALHIDPGTCATLIYTSGTTGTPKGVMCSHDACMFNALNLRELIHINDHERLISYLPLSHIAAQYVDVMAAIRSRGTLYFADQNALKGTLIKTLQKCHPTIFVGVPRVYEKMGELIKSAIAKKNYFEQYIISWAMSIGKRACEARQYGMDHTVPWGYTLAKYLVFDTIRSSLCFESCRLCVCSAAPLTTDTLNLFASFDIPIYDLLGQSEATAPISMNTPIGNLYKIGSVGRVFPGTEAKVDPVTSELLFRGRNAMMGYLHLPEETKHVIDDDRYVHTGDMAKIDEDGFIFVTGRIKELIVTAGGENVAPAYIENKIISICDCLSNVLVIGDKRKYLSCILTLKCKTDENGESTNVLNRDCQLVNQKIHSEAKTIEDVIQDPKWTEYIDSVMNEYNQKYAISRAQYIRKWVLLKRDFSIADGELTTTMKIKRNVVYEHFSDSIEQLY